VAQEAAHANANGPKGALEYCSHYRASLSRAHGAASAPMMAAANNHLLGTQSSMDSLSDDLLLKLFNAVCAMEDDTLEYGKRAQHAALARLAAVSKRFLSLVDSSPCFWEDLDRLPYGESSLSFFSRSSYPKRTEWIRNLHIDMFDWWGKGNTDASWVNDSFVKRLRHNCPNLESLDIIQNFACYEESMGLSKPRFKLPHLRKLQIVGAKRMKSLYLDCPKLEELTIEKAYELQSVSFREELELQEGDRGNVVMEKDRLPSFVAKTGGNIVSFRVGCGGVKQNY
jgi:hypothetical protein